MTLCHIIINYCNTKRCTSVSSSKNDRIWSRNIIYVLFCNTLIINTHNLQGKQSNSYLPTAKPLVAKTFTVISVDDGLLRNSAKFNSPISSLTVYDDSLKCTAIAIRFEMLVLCYNNSNDYNNLPSSSTIVTVA